MARCSSGRRTASAYPIISEGQLFILDPKTGETEKLTSIQGTVVFYVWSPKSGRIAFSDLSSVYLWG